MLEKCTRRSFLRTATLGSAALALASRIEGQPGSIPRKPNLIVFLPDQQRADTIGCYGGNPAFASNLCNLAARSFVFEQAYITQPICTPSRSSLMSGTWPHASGCTRNRSSLNGRFRCLPEMMNDPDYHCAYMGKWNLGDELWPQHGFSEWVSIMDGYQRYYGPGRDHTKISDFGEFLVSNGFKPDDKKKRNGFNASFSGKLPIELSKPRFLQAKACDFLERHQGDPFALFVAFFEPHPPYTGPLNNEHPLEEIDVDQTATEMMGKDMPLRYRAMQQSARRSFTAGIENFRRTKQRYLGLVTQVDQSIGVILSKLDQLGIADNTIVVHTSDHGDMMGAHHLFGKKVMFQEATRVPYFVHMPNQHHTVSISQPVSHIDFLPTLLDLLGKPPDNQCMGKSHAQLLRGESMPAENVFVQWAPEAPHVHTHEKSLEVQHVITESTRAVVTPDHWKLCLRDRDKNELYNLSVDPREEHNAFYDGHHGEIIDRLTHDIHTWQERVGDTLKVSPSSRNRAQLLQRPPERLAAFGFLQFDNRLTHYFACRRLALSRSTENGQRVVFALLFAWKQPGTSGQGNLISVIPNKHLARDLLYQICNYPKLRFDFSPHVQVSHHCREAQRGQRPGSRPRRFQEARRLL